PSRPETRAGDDSPARQGQGPRRQVPRRSRPEENRAETDDEEEVWQAEVIATSRSASDQVRSIAAKLAAWKGAPMSEKKTAIVVGVGPEEGLGAALCKRFARAGLHVFIGG